MAANPKSFFFEILSDLDQAVPNHIADGSKKKKRIKADTQWSSGISD